jgi:hypothetical protein
MDFLDLFLDWGGHWLALLVGFGIILATRRDEEDDLRRWQATFATPAFGVAGVALALAAWVEHYARLQWGLEFVRGTGRYPDLPAVLLPVVLLLATIAALGYRRWPALRPWLSLALVVALIVGGVRTLAEGPEEPLVRGDRGSDVRFAQQRLVALGCFAATGEPAETEGIYGTATHEAVVVFQLANHFDRPRLDLPFLGQLRPRQEWRLLKRPFPWLDGPRRCGEGE